MLHDAGAQSSNFKTLLSWHDSVVDWVARLGQIIVRIGQTMTAAIAPAASLCSPQSAALVFGEHFRRRS
jgi:hypothetical protein